MKKVLVAFGTRPEAIKMCPVVNELKRRKDIEVYTCISGQHRELLGGILDSFGVCEDYNLNIMKDGQTLFDITSNILEKFKDVLYRVSPDMVLVHGDTSTAFACALAAFYLNIPVGHIEAGLRSGNIFEPYPEEFNRRVISLISSHDFAPTEMAKKNLLDEGKDGKRIFVTGNTVIDAIRTTVTNNYTHSELEWAKKGKIVLLTSHRRENLGEPQKAIFKAIKRVAEEHRDIRIIFPIHPNPKIRKIAEQELLGVPNIHVIEPLDVVDFHNFIARSYLIITDSGGIQEEAAALCKPTLVLRNNTERPEGLKNGGLKLVGTDEKDVYENFKLLINDKKIYNKMCSAKNPYGDGEASVRIADIIERIK